MIEIYLNPDNQDLFQDSTEAKGQVDNGAYLEAADKLLEDLRRMGDNSPKSAFKGVACAERVVGDAGEVCWKRTC